MPPRTRRPAVPGRTALPRPATPRQRTATTPRPAPAAPGPETAEPESHDAPAEDDHEDAVPDEQDDEAAPGSDPDDGDAPRDEDAPADAGGEAGDAPDPALVTDLTEHLDQIKAAADAAELVLTASGDLKTVLAGLDEISEQAAQARRALKAAIGGRKAPAVRPGGLRDKVLAHLDAHPDGEFTPHEIHKVLGHSSGAIANALDTLVKLGEAEVATEKPRRFRRAAQPAEAAPEADERTARTARSRTAPNWRVPRDNPHGSRGGSVPPRPPAGKPQQWFVLRPWVFDVTLAGVLLRAAPRPPVPIPVAAWARAYGLARDPGSGRHAISLIGPGPDFSPEYAMTTDPDEPVILATLAGAGGEPTPLLIDGCHRLYKAAVTGRAEIPAFVLTAAETLLIRSDAVLGPPRPAQPPGTAQHPHHRNGGEPRC